MSIKHSKLKLKRQTQTTEEKSSLCMAPAFPGSVSGRAVLLAERAAQCLALHLHEMCVSWPTSRCTARSHYSPAPLSPGLQHPPEPRECRSADSWTTFPLLSAGRCLIRSVLQPVPCRGCCWEPRGAVCPSVGLKVTRPATSSSSEPLLPGAAPKGAGQECGLLVSADKK